MQTVFDVTKGADYRAAFDLIPESRVKAILSTNWSGQMFSQRVWDNTNALADGLKHDMLVGIMAGKSEQHMADDIMTAAVSALSRHAGLSGRKLPALRIRRSCTATRSLTLTNTSFPPVLTAAQAIYAVSLTVRCSSVTAHRQV